jgi:hypothetical protein
MFARRVFMPNMHAAVHATNNRLAPGTINQIPKADIDAVPANATLLDLVRTFNLTRRAATLEFVSTWPAAQSVAAAAAIMSALRRRPRMPVTLAWIPGYDYKVTISESAGIQGSAGEMTIVLESRYPGDGNNATVRMTEAAQAASTGAAKTAAKKSAKKAPAKKKARARKATRRRR